MTYQENIARGLSRAYAEAPQLEAHPGSLKMIIFSDHHKGRRDQADDFAACEQTYLEALAYYQEQGFTLAILGDAEEFWENRPQETLPRYRSVMEIERTFNEDGRYLRFFGNHDDEWCYPDSVRSNLEPLLGELHVYEGLRLQFPQLRELHAEIFLVHGHQGTLESDRLSWITRAIVRHIWRPIQRLTNFRLTTPATDWRLRHRHEVAMYNWAIAQSGVLLITGHTHHPIFPSHAWLTQLIDRYQELRRQPEGLDDEQLNELETEIAYARQQIQPCFFNTGCCSFADGSITGVELADSEIRLVRWANSGENISRKVLDNASIFEIMGRIQLPSEPISDEIPSAIDR
ncbi:MAG: hypothetical protein P1P76_10055 [Anaerolineales bacterium]|nr:hypothetical protein [Anaerolineales bacterium]